MADFDGEVIVGPTTIVEGTYATGIQVGASNEGETIEPASREVTINLRRANTKKLQPKLETGD